MSRFLESYQKILSRQWPGPRKEPPETVDLRIKIRTQIADSAVVSYPYVVMNVLATVVAAYGLIANSTAVVIGAMVIAQLLGPINGIALALVDGDLGLLRRAMFAEVIGAALVLLTAFGVAEMHVGIPLSPEILSRTQPSLLDLMIALAGGAAGAFATASPRISSGLVGVAIATALVPPLSSAAICLASGKPTLAGGAMLLFLINLVAIQFATSFVLWILGYHRLFAKEESIASFAKRNTPSALPILALGYGLFVGLKGTLARSREEFEIRDLLVRQLAAYPGTRLADFTVRSASGRRVIVATIRTPYSFAPDQVSAIQARLPVTAGIANELHIRSVLIKEADASSYLHQIPRTETSPGADSSIEFNSPGMP